MSDPASLPPADAVQLTPEQREVLELELDLAERIEWARHDFSEYVELTATTDKGRPMRQAWLHRSWQGHVRWSWAHGLHPILLAPWGHGKTVQLAVEMIPWLLGRNRALRTLVVTNVDDNSKLRVAQIERIIKRRRALSEVFPDLRLKPGPHSVHEFDVAGVPDRVDKSLASFGVFGSGTSRRADFEVFDDIVDENNAIKSPGLRPQVIEHVDMKWLPRLEPPCMVCECTGTVGGVAALEAGEYALCKVCDGTGGGRSIGIGTAWHVEDYWHNRMTTPGFCVLVQRVLPSQCGYSSEAYGVPAGLQYPSLEELVLYGAPAQRRERLLEQLGRDLEAMRRLEAV